MSRSILALSACLATLAATAVADAAEPSVEQIQATIAGRVEQLLACRQPDGSFVLGKPEPLLSDLYGQFPMGQTALAVMALQYARPHLKGELQSRAYDACREGVAWIVQRPPEPRTYSAGLILTVLYQENPDRYRKLIDAYAVMVALSQHDKGDHAGEWGYRLAMPPGWTGPRVAPDSWGDRSNTQFALLGLYNAERAGFQVPKVVWERAAKHYVDSQFLDGGWGYNPRLRPQPYVNMTLASTISLELCAEMVLAEGHKQCKPPPRLKAVDAGLKWIADNWERGGLGNSGPDGRTGAAGATGAGGVGSDTYGLYALERLGILMGRANIGGHDWYAEGAATLLEKPWQSMFGTHEVTNCFGIAFLARGLEPVVVNKLERRGATDWNNDPYDVKHLVEFIEGSYQQPAQWRIVTLEAPLDLLLKTPILYISGHYKLDFDDAEKAKLKAYVRSGGTILAQACCAKKEFDESVRALAKELFDAEFRAFPEGHRVFERMQVRGVQPKPDALFAPIAGEQDRPAMIYLPTDFCCRWHSGGPAAREAFAVGTGIYFYVTVECRRAYLRAHPDAGVAPPPEQDPQQERKPEGPPADVVPGKPDAKPDPRPTQPR